MSRNRVRSLGAALVALAALFVAGCAALQPVELPPERASPPAPPLLWHSLSELRGGDWHLLLDNGPRALDWRLVAIDSASYSIDLQTFLWTWDTTGSLVVDHLISAADRGVRVRILVDDTFLVSEDALLVALHRHPNIEYRVFNPFKRRASSILSRQLLNAAEFGRLDHRMHNKAMVVDNQVAIVGGRNLADEYFGLHDDTNFRDLELLVGGPVVRELSAAFDAYWNADWSFPVDALSHVQTTAADLERIRRIRSAGAGVHAEQTPAQRWERWFAAAREAVAGTPILLVDDPPEDDPTSAASQPVQVARELLAVFESAREDILIVSAYLIPTPDFERAVARALRRGVSVRILTNSVRSNNHLPAHSAYRNHIGTLMSAGAKLHEVRIDARDRHRHMLPPVAAKKLALHAKALAVDRDRVFIGSANLDPRSLRINTEMGLLVHSETLNDQLRKAVAPDFLRANAWELRFGEDGGVLWISDEGVLDAQPAESFMQNIEDWFFAHLPIEDEL